MSRSSQALTYVPASVLKNAAAPVLKPLLRRPGLYGMDGQIPKVLRTLERLSSIDQHVNIDLNEKSVLELGPGLTPHLMAAMVVAGASRALGVDVRAVMPSGWSDKATFSGLVDALVAGGAPRFMERFCTNPESIKKRFDSFGATMPIEYRVAHGDVLPAETDSIKLIYSKSVLEHVRREFVPKLVSEQFRVLEPGGYAIHTIDLRDHTKINDDYGVSGDWLDALRYPEWLHDMMTSNRVVHINRLRSTDWDGIFKAAGFEIASWAETRFELAPSFSPGRLAGPFRVMFDVRFLL